MTTAAPCPNRIELRTGPLEFRDRGSGPPVVFVHGLMTNGTLWRGVVDQLHDTHRCLSPDWPIGAHSLPQHRDADLTPQATASLVAEFLDRLDLRDVTLVANDTGGAIAQLVAINHPDRLGRLVLTPCDAFDNFLPAMFRPLQYAARVPGLVGLVLQALRLRPLRRLPMAFGLLTKRPTPATVVDGWLRPAQHRRGVRRDTEKFLRSINPRITMDAARQLPGFDKPVLLAWASEDRVFPPEHARRLAALIPDARVEWIDDSYSFIPEDQPTRLAELIASFVADSQEG